MITECDLWATGTQPLEEISAAKVEGKTLDKLPVDGTGDGAELCGGQGMSLACITEGVRRSIQLLMQMLRKIIMLESNLIDM